jgi:hypothetical protein
MRHELRTSLTHLGFGTVTADSVATGLAPARCLVARSPSSTNELEEEVHHGLAESVRIEWER